MKKVDFWGGGVPYIYIFLFDIPIPFSSHTRGFPNSGALSMRMHGSGCGVPWHVTSTSPPRRCVLHRCGTVGPTAGFLFGFDSKEMFGRMIISLEQHIIF